MTASWTWDIGNIGASSTARTSLPVDGESISTGIQPAYFYLHFKECEFRFNHRHQNL